MWDAIEDELEAPGRSFFNGAVYEWLLYSAQGAGASFLAVAILHERILDICRCPISHQCPIPISPSLLAKRNVHIPAVATFKTDIGLRQFRLQLELL